MPNTRLRLIALVVSEPEPGCFQWKLLESSDHGHAFGVALATAPTTLPSYSQALRAGEACLMALAGRSAAGPRAPGRPEAETHARAGMPAQAEAM